MPDRLDRLATRLRRARGLHFVAGGVLLHLLIGSAVEPTEPVHIGPEEQARLRAGWIAATGREPTEAEFSLALQREQDDEILVREALETGLHRRDMVVRQRLAMNMRFLDPDTRSDEDVLVAQAERMDMHRNDLVVRRRLVQLMEFALSEPPAEAPVSEAEVRQMYARRTDELTQPARWRIRHVYFSQDRRGARAGEEARRAAASLNAVGRGGDADAIGDPFLGGRELPLLTANQLEGQFGTGFMASLPNCKPAVWCAPIPSSFGQHAVLIEEYVPERVPGPDAPDVRARLESDVRRQRAEERLQQGLAALRLKYGVGG